MRGMNQEDFAEILGVHRNYLGHIERGEIGIGIDNLAKIAAKLGLPPASLLLDGMPYLISND